MSESSSVAHPASGSDNVSSAPAEKPVLRVEDLAVGFHTEGGHVQAVRGVSFAMARGRTLAIVGESGSGKSVTAYSILRLIRPPGRIERGNIILSSADGETTEITALAESDERLYQVRGGRIGMIFQEPMSALSPVHTIGNQIGEAIELHRTRDPDEVRRIATEVLTDVGIPDPVGCLDQFPHELSGGMRQRAVIAMALVTRPEVLIADEPTTALDVTIQAQVLALIRRLQAKMQTSVLFITHDIGVVAQIADDVAVMYQGRIVEHGSVRQVLKSPAHPYTKGLLAAIPGLSPGRRRLPTVHAVLEAAGFDLDEDLPLRSVAPGHHAALPLEASS